MCPPGVDQTTRTTQRWTFLAPLLGEKYDITNDFTEHYESRQRKFLFGDYTWDAFDKLAHRPQQGYRLNYLISQPRRSNDGSRSTLERMPAELLSMIISDPSLHASDVFSFGLCSRLLWNHLLNHVQKECRKAPWAGTPLLCTGGWLMSVSPAIHALYPNMKQEEDEFFNRPGRGPQGRPARGMCPARRFNWGAIET